MLAVQLDECNPARPSPPPMFEPVYHRTTAYQQNSSIRRISTETFIFYAIPYVTKSICLLFDNYS